MVCIFIHIFGINNLEFISFLIILDIKLNDSVIIFYMLSPQKLSVCVVNIAQNASFYLIELTIFIFIFKLFSLICVKIRGVFSSVGKRKQCKLSSSSKSWRTTVFIFYFLFL